VKKKNDNNNNIGIKIAIKIQNIEEYYCFVFYCGEANKYSRIAFKRERNKEKCVLLYLK
jgi:hypothetical protein